MRHRSERIPTKCVLSGLHLADSLVRLNGGVKRRTNLVDIVSIEAVAMRLVVAYLLDERLARRGLVG